MVAVTWLHPLFRLEHTLGTSGDFFEVPKAGENPTSLPLHGQGQVPSLLLLLSPLGMGEALEGSCLLPARLPQILALKLSSPPSRGSSSSEQSKEDGTEGKEAGGGYLAAVVSLKSSQTLPTQVGWGKEATGRRRAAPLK